MATIYIVEDDVNIREIERYALKNSGYEVEEFESGESLFKRLERAVPSLLLLDIMLPDEDGLEILGKLRANKNTAAIPVIMVTAKTSELDKVKGLDLGGLYHEAVWRDGADFQSESAAAQDAECGGGDKDLPRRDPDGQRQACGICRE